MPVVNRRPKTGENISPESSAGGWDRYAGDWFSRIVNIEGHEVCLSVYRSGSDYHGYVTDYGAPIGKSVHIVTGPAGLTTMKARAVKLAMELDYAG